jgi:hypothetical protein
MLDAPLWSGVMSESDSDWAEGLPYEARVRAMEYIGDGVPKSHAKAAALRDLGYRNKEVADLLEVTQDAAASYYSKFNLNLVNETIQLALAAFGGPKKVMGWNMLSDGEEKEYWYIMKPLSEPEDVNKSQSYPPEGEVVLVKVSADAKTFNAESTVYSCIDAMADDIYRSVGFTDEQQAYEVHGMLTESGMSMESLEDPRFVVSERR